MINAIVNRLRILSAKAAGDPLIRLTNWKDVGHEAFKRYGRHKAGIRRRMKIERTGPHLRVEMPHRIIYWPAGAGCNRLADVYFEVFHEGNNHYFDIPETRVEPGDVVLDCGACEGYFTIKALESGASRVFAIEPGQAICDCLNHTFGNEIAAGRVSLHDCLLGDRSDRVMFHEDPSDPTICRIYSWNETLPQQNVRTVAMTTIDEFCERHAIRKVDFIKADVEGGESGLLRGAEKTLRAHKPKLAIAAYHNPDDANRMVEYLDKLDIGYRFKVKGIVCFDAIPRPVMMHCY